jgi:hypothetical protein
MTWATADYLVTSRQAAGHLAAGLTAAGHPEAGSGALGRIALVAVAVAALAVFTALQIRARRREVPDWRTPPSRYGLGPQQDEAPSGNQERYRPDWRYGYPPSRDPGGDQGWSQGGEPGRRERGPAS